MTDYPTTPPSDLIEQWLNEPQYITADQAGRLMEMVSMTKNRLMELMQKSATYGADQELKACLNWFERYYKDETWIDLDSRTFRLARRPEKRSLKKLALAVLDDEPEADDMKELIVFDTAQVDIIRRALESLPDD